jgi:hypothetical protein
MSVSGLPTFLISVKNMNLLSSSIYKHLKTYLIDTKAMGQTEPHFLSDPMSDRNKKKKLPTLSNIYKKQHGARPCVEKIQLIFFVPPKMKVKGYM